MIVVVRYRYSLYLYVVEIYKYAAGCLVGGMMFAVHSRQHSLDRLLRVLFTVYLFIGGFGIEH